MQFHHQKFMRKNQTDSFDVDAFMCEIQFRKAILNVRSDTFSDRDKKQRVRFKIYTEVE